MDQALHIIELPQSYLGHCRCLHGVSLTYVTVVVLLATVAK